MLFRSDSDAVPLRVFLRMRRRGEVIDYVRKKYGNDCVANIITYGTLGAKMVIRDISRVHNLAFADADRLAKMIPAELKMTLEKALKQSPELKTAYETEEVTRELIDTAFVLEDLARNSSVHAAGVVIAPSAVTNFVPVRVDDEGAVVTQVPDHDVEALGLLKMDFLGLRNLDIIQDALRLIRPDQQQYGAAVDVIRQAEDTNLRNPNGACAAASSTAVALTDAEGGVPTVVWVIVGLAFLVIVGGLAWLLTKGKRK